MFDPLSIIAASSVVIALTVLFVGCLIVWEWGRR